MIGKPVRLDGILAYFYKGSVLKLTDKDKLKLIRKACPHIQYNARGACGLYLELREEEWPALTQDRITTYLLKSHEFDAVDISAIVKTINGDYPQAPGAVEKTSGL